MNIFGVVGSCLAYSTVASGTNYTKTITGTGSGTLDGVIISGVLGGQVTITAGADGVSDSERTTTMSSGSIVGDASTSLVGQSRMNQYFQQRVSISGCGSTEAYVYVYVYLSNDYKSYTISASASIRQNNEYVTFYAGVSDASRIQVTLTYVK